MQLTLEKRNAAETARDYNETFAEEMSSEMSVRN